MRFLVFGYWGFYPAGGMNDCIHKTDSKEDAEEFAENTVKEDDYDYYQIYDTKLGGIIKGGKR